MVFLLDSASISTKKTKIKKAYLTSSEGTAISKSENNNDNDIVNSKNHPQVDENLIKAYFKTISLCKDLSEFISQETIEYKKIQRVGHKEDNGNYDLPPSFYFNNQSIYGSLSSSISFLGFQKALLAPINIDEYSLNCKYVVKITLEHVDLSSHTIEATLKMQSSSCNNLVKEITDYEGSKFDIETWLSGQIIGNKYQFTSGINNVERDHKRWVSIFFNSLSSRTFLNIRD